MSAKEQFRTFRDARTIKTINEMNIYKKIYIYINNDLIGMYGVRRWDCGTFYAYIKFSMISGISQIAIFFI